MAGWDNHEGIVTADLSGFTIDGIQYLDIPRPAHGETCYQHPWVSLPASGVLRIYCESGQLVINGNVQNNFTSRSIYFIQIFKKISRLICPLFRQIF